MLLTVICLVVASTICQLRQFVWLVPKINYTLIPIASSSHAVNIKFFCCQTTDFASYEVSFDLLCQKDFALILKESSCYAVGINF